MWGNPLLKRNELKAPCNFRVAELPTWWWGSQSKCPKRDQQKPPRRPYLTCSRKSPSITSTVFHLLTLSKKLTFSRVRDTVSAFRGKDIKEFADTFLNYFWDTKQHYRIRQPIQWKCEFVEIHSPYLRNCLIWIM